MSIRRLPLFLLLILLSDRPFRPWLSCIPTGSGSGSSATNQVFLKSLSARSLVSVVSGLIVVGAARPAMP